MSERLSERVQIDLKDGVADVRMIRTDKLNAIDSAMFDALVEAGKVLSVDRAVRAVVLSGEGRAFCAGLDMGSFAAMAGPSRTGDAPAQNLLERGPSGANRAQLAAWIWQEVPVPVIAAVHGVAYGGGLQIALGADLRIVAPDARMSVMEVKWGLIPDMSASQTLRRLVPIDVAMELTFTGYLTPSPQRAMSISWIPWLAMSPPPRNLRIQPIMPPSLPWAPSRDNACVVRVA